MSISLTYSLILLSTFLGSYIAGLVPLRLRRSIPPKAESYIQAMAAGVLIGVVFLTIIPEGLEHLTLAAQGTVGPALLIGFMAMFLVEHVGGCFVYGMSPGGVVGPSTITWMAMVVHATCDGLALGAAVGVRGAKDHSEAIPVTRTEDGQTQGLDHDETHHDHSSISALTWIVWVALMLHKIPASFAVTTFLMASSPVHVAHLRLLIFSAACPISALLTSTILGTWMVSYLGENGPGMLLVFSAGTFLYVATLHMLPEALKEDTIKPLLTPRSGSMLQSGEQVLGNPQTTKQRRQGEQGSVDEVFDGGCDPNVLPMQHAATALNATSTLLPMGVIAEEGGPSYSAESCLVQQVCQSHGHSHQPVPAPRILATLSGVAIGWLAAAMHPHH